MRHAILFAAVAMAGAALDFLTKHLVCNAIEQNGPEIVIIENFFSFGHTRNPGIIFGMFPKAQVVFLVVSILAVPAIVAIFAAVRKPRWILTVSLGLILAGTLGNLYDRAAYSEVRDFIKFTYRDQIWPLFNLADSYICVGVLLLSIEMLFFDEKKKKKKDEDSGKKIEAAPAPSGVEGPPQGGGGAPPPADPPAPGPEAGPVGGDRPAPAG